MERIFCTQFINSNAIYITVTLDHFWEQASHRYPRRMNKYMYGIFISSLVSMFDLSLLLTAIFIFLEIS